MPTSTLSGLSAGITDAIRGETHCSGDPDAVVLGALHGVDRGDCGGLAVHRSGQGVAEAGETLGGFLAPPGHARAVADGEPRAAGGVTFRTGTPEVVVVEPDSPAAISAAVLPSFPGAAFPPPE